MTHETQRTALFTLKDLFCWESPYDLAKYILSVSHSPLVISYSHRCTLARTQTPKATDFRQVWTALFFSPATEQSCVYSI